MNQKDVMEIRRRINGDKSAISRICGCYVNMNKEIISTFSRSLAAQPQDETDKYFALFRKIFSGVPGRNLLEMNFSTDQVMDGEEHHQLTALREGSLDDDEALLAFYQKVIDSYESETNYLILLTKDTYDVPRRGSDGAELEDSFGVFSYILCTICPVKPTKPVLHYDHVDKDFRNRGEDWVVSAPDVGFMFPGYEDGGANIYKALYYSKDSGVLHDDLIDAVFAVGAPLPAETQKASFDAVLEDTLEEELDLGVIQTVQEQLTDRIEEHKKDKTAGPLVITKGEVAGILRESGVSEEHVEAFGERFDSDFGMYTELLPRNIIHEKKLEMTTPDVVIKVNPERGDLVQTRVIDGTKYILVRAEDGVQVNGVNISIN